jgi:hypothetical protein
LAKGYETAKGHFKKVTERIRSTVERVKENRARQLPKNNRAQISKHAMKQRSIDAGNAARKQTKMKQNIPTPTPRRGR